MSDLLTAGGVLQWAKPVCGTMSPSKYGYLERDEQAAEFIAAAMRMRAAWLAHRDKLVRFAAIATADRPHYVTVNRHTLTKALREFIADMAKAEEG